jgi:hypothetical protein
LFTAERRPRKTGVNWKWKLELACESIAYGQAASYSRLRFGAFVPVAEHDFGCGDQLHGGELT